MRQETGLLNSLIPSCFPDSHILLSVLVDKDARLRVQGITGRASVTPGRGG